MTTSSKQEDAIKLRLPDGRNLAYSEFGDPAGRPLLYFHGGVSSRLDIKFADDYCKCNSIRVIAVDRPGTGLSDPMLPKLSLSLDSWVSDVRCLLSHLEISRLPLLGWSLAGPYVFACSYYLPQISRAATIGAAGPLDNNEAVHELGLWFDRLLLNLPDNMHWVAGNILVMLAQLPPPILKKVMLSDLSAEADREVVRRLPDDLATDFLYESIRQGPQGVIDDYKATAKSWTFPANEIKIDIQLWQGGDDKLCPMAMAKGLEQLIPTAKLNVVPGQGHFLLHNNLDTVIGGLMKD